MRESIAIHKKEIITIGIGLFIVAVSGYFVYSKAVATPPPNGKEDLENKEVGTNVPDWCDDAPPTAASVIEQEGYALVVVTLRVGANTSVEDVRIIQDRALDLLNESDWVWSRPERLEDMPAIAGFITQSGFDKLNRSTDVESIEVDGFDRPGC